MLWSLNLLFVSKFNDSFKFLYNIDNKIPNENSKPATPKIKKEILNNVISQYTAPNNTDNVYKIIHTNSDINKIDIKFFGLRDIINKKNQNNIDQNEIQVNI